MSELHKWLRLWGLLEHENITKVLGSAFVNEVPSVITEWYTDGNVAQYLEKNPRADRRSLVLDAAKGLQYLHSHLPPICHGDVKSSNVMIRHDGRAVLCDFGLAQVLDEEFERLASQSSHRGTLRWTSPERLSQDGPLAPPSDVWSWAWLIWQFLTEKDPFHSINNHIIVMYRIMSLKLPASEQEPVILEIPTLSRLLELCWQKDPASRLRIDECIELLERIVSRSALMGGFLPTKFIT
ncbi:hypothetical protein M407DRAFT_77771 [Tulasnella calospora MUT 4182]|uniref:Protein kinase domain-containing protein n=1 Tax=Tulasnella calospora MUT 4182 TaxID=1051891 RepID=A0A0C3KQM8_9AGAM|nr:hypothetical protein M407DRAFT_77771 [Tulasnella calospora MUT 4182]